MTCASSDYKGRPNYSEGNETASACVRAAGWIVIHQGSSEAPLCRQGAMLTLARLGEFSEESFLIERASGTADDWISRLHGWSSTGRTLQLYWWRVILITWESRTLYLLPSDNQLSIMPIAHRCNQSCQIQSTAPPWSYARSLWKHEGQAWNDPTTHLKHLPLVSSTVPLTWQVHPENPSSPDLDIQASKLPGPLTLLLTCLQSVLQRERKVLREKDPLALNKWKRIPIGCYRPWRVVLVLCVKRRLPEIPTSLRQPLDQQR